MAKTLQLSPIPDDGLAVTVTTSDCALSFIILEVSQGQIVKYVQAIKVNVPTDFTLPAGVYRFNFHYSNTAGPAKFTSAVKTPSGDFPKNAANGSGSADQGEFGLTAYRVEV